MENQFVQRYTQMRRAYEACFAKHMEAGVVFFAPDGILIDDTVEIAAGATVLPGTILRGSTKVGAGSVIGPNSLLEDVCVGENVVFNASQGYSSIIEDAACIGPFSHIRPNSHIGRGVHLGDFVEIKNASIGAGTSVSHLTYVGDATVGQGCNFGCGVAVANYDGVSKNRCIVGDYAFIGCNTNLVAPVSIGDGAYTAAGSTITEDVPACGLGLARARQVNKENWAAQRLAPYVEKQRKKIGGE